MEHEKKKLRTKKTEADTENDRNDESEETNDVYNCILTYDIWRLVFKYLNGRDLCTASLVCR